MGEQGRITLDLGHNLAFRVLCLPWRGGKDPGEASLVSPTGHCSLKFAKGKLMLL